MENNTLLWRAAPGRSLLLLEEVREPVAPVLAAQSHCRRISQEPLRKARSAAMLRL